MSSPLRPPKEKKVKEEIPPSIFEKLLDFRFFEKAWFWQGMSSLILTFVMLQSLGMYGIPTSWIPARTLIATCLFPYLHLWFQGNTETSHAIAFIQLFLVMWFLESVDFLTTAE